MIRFELTNSIYLKRIKHLVNMKWDDFCHTTTFIQGSTINTTQRVSCSMQSWPNPIRLRTRQDWTGIFLNSGGATQAGRPGRGGLAATTAHTASALDWLAGWSWLYSVQRQPDIASYGRTALHVLSVYLYLCLPSKLATLSSLVYYRVCVLFYAVYLFAVCR